MKYLESLQKLALKNTIFDNVCGISSDPYKIQTKSVKIICEAARLRTELYGKTSIEYSLQRGS